MEERFRHELKHYINYSDYLQLKARLPCVCKLDENAGEDGRYKVHSLYFDSYSDRVVVEKLSGVSRREKFRLRYYNSDTSYIMLEKKSKIKRLCAKHGMQIAPELCEAVISGDYQDLIASGDSLLSEFYAKIHYQNLRPKSIVDYTREAYIFSAGNVRVTIDSDIRTSNNVNEFLSPNRVGIPCANSMLLEVKYDDFLPDVVRDIIQLNNRMETEFSKYVVARII